jgi:hypothetical protein
MTVVAKVTDAATRTPVAGATVTAIRAGRGTTLLSTDSTAMPAPLKTDVRGRAAFHVHFRSAGDPIGYSVFVARSFLHVQAPGFRPADVRISPIGRLDFARMSKHPEVAIPVKLVHE